MKVITKEYTTNINTDNLSRDVLLEIVDKIIRTQLELRTSILRDVEKKKKADKFDCYCMYFTCSQLVYILTKILPDNPDLQELVDCMKETLEVIGKPK